MASRVTTEILAMKFDARSFKAGIESTIQYVDKMKTALTFTKPIKEFDDLDRAAQRFVAFEVLGLKAEKMVKSVSAMVVASGILISKTVSSALSGLNTLFQEAVMQPMKDGMAEFELQMGSIQTILANTKSKGTGLGEVTAALDELNQYADLTIYNFGEMTRNIGTFTAAGVDLDQSVLGIKGIANLAAISGSNSQQASTAMYQLSQAISTGTVKLMDWNSVVNAGMGGEVFQNALVQTALVADDVSASTKSMLQDIVSGERSFRDTLQEGWLSADVLLDTLSQFTGDMTDAELAAMGFNEEEIRGIQELADTAVDAATKVKSVSQIIDVYKEALGTGWADTWKLIFGDFYEARDLFTSISEALGDVISSSAEKRNEMVEMWAVGGGRSAAIQAFWEFVRAVQNVSTAMRDAWEDIFPPVEAWQRGRDLVTVTRSIRDFLTKIADGLEKADRFKDFIRGIAAGFDILKMAAKALIIPFEGSGETVTKVLDGLMNILSRFGDWVVGLREKIIENNTFEVWIREAMEWLAEAKTTLEGFINTFLNLKPVKAFVDWLGKLEKQDAIDFFDKLGKTVDKLRGYFRTIKFEIRRFLDVMGDLKTVKLLSTYLKILDFSPIIDSLKGLGGVLKKVFPSLGEAFSDSFGGKDVVGTWIKRILSLDDAFSTSKLFTPDGVSLAKKSIGLVGKAIEKLTGFAEGFLGFAGTFIEGLGSAYTAISEFIDKIFVYVGPQLNKLLDHFITGGLKLVEGILNTFSKMDWSEVGTAINTGLFSALMGGVGLAITKFLTTDWIGDFKAAFLGETSLGGRLDQLFAPFKALEGVLTSYQQNIKADTLQKIAIAIGVLALSVIGLSFIDPGRLAVATAAIGALLVELFGSSSLTKTLSTKEAAKASGILISLSGALLLLSSSVSKMGQLDPDEIERGLLAISASLTALVVATREFGGGKGKKIISSSIAMVIMAEALIILAGAVWLFGHMDMVTLENGLAGVGVALAEFAGFSRLVNSKGVLKSAIATGVLAAAVGILTIAVKRFGEMDPAVLEQGLLSVAAGLGELVLATQGMPKDSELKAGSLLVLSGALVVMSYALQTLSVLSWDDIARGLTAIAGTLTLMVVALDLMTGTIAGSVALVIASGAIVIMSYALTQFAELDWEDLAKGLVAVGGSLALLVIGLELMTTALPGAAALLVASFAMMILAGVIERLGTLGWEVMLTGLAGLAAVLAILGVAAALMTPVIPSLMALAIAIGIIGIAFGAIGVGIGIAAAGISMFLLAFVAFLEIVLTEGGKLIEFLPQIGEAIIETVVAMIVKLGESVPLLVEAAENLIRGFLSAVVNVTPDIITSIFTLIGTLLDELSAHTEEFTLKGGQILTDFLNGVAENLDDVIVAAADVVIAFMDGLSEKLPDLVDASFDFIEAFLDAMTAAIDEKLPDLIKKFNALGLSLVKGLIAGILGGIPDSIEAAKDIGQSVLDSVAKIWDAHSPSRKATALGQYFTVGLMNGFLGEEGSLEAAMLAMINEVLKVFASRVDDFELIGTVYARKFLVGYVLMFKKEGNVIVELMRMLLDKLIPYSKNYEKLGYDYAYALLLGFDKTVIMNYDMWILILEELLLELRTVLPLFIQLGEAQATAIVDGFLLKEAYLREKMLAVLAMAAAILSTTMKQFYYVGTNIVDSIAQGIRDNTASAIAAAQALVDGINSALDGINSPDLPGSGGSGGSGGGSGPYGSTYIPVVSSGTLGVRGFRAVSSRVKSSASSVAYSSSVGSIGSQASNLTHGENEATVTFVQNNYSPKPLDPIEIYRQTNNQISRLRRSKLG